SELTGGKFRNGARSAAIVHLFNDAAHEIKNRWQREKNLYEFYNKTGWVDAQFEKYPLETALFIDYASEITFDLYPAGFEPGMTYQEEAFLGFEAYLMSRVDSAILNNKYSDLIRGVYG